MDWDMYGNGGLVKVDKEGENYLDRATVDHWIAMAGKERTTAVLVRNALRSLPAAASIARVLASDKRKRERLQTFVLVYLRLQVTLAHASGDRKDIRLLNTAQERFDDIAVAETGEHIFRFEVVREATHCLTGSRAWDSCAHASVGRINSYFRGAAAADGEMRNQASEVLFNTLQRVF